MPVVVIIVDFDGVVSPYVVVSIVEIAIDFVALVLVAIVVSGGAIETNCVELPPSALLINGLTVGIVVVTCTYKKCKIKHKTFKTIYTPEKINIDVI